MITLYTFGPAFGLPDPSPFVMKAHVLLQMSGLPYRVETGGFRKAPKGKLPFIDDDGARVADSSFIRLHLEQRHGIDFDKSLDAAGKGIAWAFEKLCEDHLYWAMVHDRWMDPTNFDNGPRKFFSIVPAPLRPLVIFKVQRDLKRTLRGQGLGRHTREEIAALAERGVQAIAGQLGSKPFLMGEIPCGADATVFGTIAGFLCPVFASASKTAIERQPNLVAYRDRGMRLWFPELATA